jgi:uncharacterized protein (TIGR02594 family)
MKMPTTLNLGLYNDLLKFDGPRHLIEGLKTFGTLESKGAANNPTILDWADEIGKDAGTSYAKWVADWYDKDSIPWCGLWSALIMCRADRADQIPAKFLSALEWAKFGKGVGEPMLGDIVTFKREGGGHVGLYVGEDADCYHVLGGNQADSVNVTRIVKTRLYAARRPLYKVQPVTVAKIFRGATGPVSVNEG